MGSLSEGQKHKESSSGSEVGDIDIDDEDEEEKIIEMRRRKREELMKVVYKDFFLTFCKTNKKKHKLKNQNHSCFNSFLFIHSKETSHGFNEG